MIFGFFKIRKDFKNVIDEKPVDTIPKLWYLICMNKYLSIGYLRSSNLCNEILVDSSLEQFASCNL